MKVGEAKNLYGNAIKDYNQKASILAKKKEELDKKISSGKGDVDQYIKESVTLELQYNDLSKMRDKYQEYISKLMEQWEAKFNLINSENEAKNSKEYADDMAKIMLVARRIMHGDIVPAADERKLMEYSADLYQMAKNIGMMAKMEKREKHDSLWEDKEDTKQADPAVEADNQEVTTEGPEIVSAESLIS